MNNATKIAEIKTEASKATIMLKEMSLNSTLMAECASMEASMKQAMASGKSFAKFPITAVYILRDQY